MIETREKGEIMDIDLTRRACCVLLANAILAPSVAHAAEATPTYPKLSRGINFHHLLNWPAVKQLDGKLSYAWPPFQAPNYKVSKQELSALAGLGFDFIRLTADPSILIAINDSRQSYLTELIRTTCSHLIEAGFKVIFDLHPVAVNPDYAPAKIVENLTSPVFRSYGDLVERIAGALKDMPHDKFAFELMNEPSIWGDSGALRWQSMLEDLHARARTAAPDLPLVLSGPFAGNLQGLVRLDVKPFQHSNVLYTFHYYAPGAFTHQGFEHYEARRVSDLAWPPRKNNVDQVLERALARTQQDSGLDQEAKRRESALTSRLLLNYLKTNHGPEQIRADFNSVAQWASQNGISPDRILLGEFGCVAESNHLPVSNDRFEWLRVVRIAAHDFKFSWAFWAYKGYGGMALANAASNELDEGILSALGLKS
jgi:hypothetical protein